MSETNLIPDDFPIYRSWDDILERSTNEQLGRFIRLCFHLRNAGPTPGPETPASHSEEGIPLRQEPDQAQGIAPGEASGRLYHAGTCAPDSRAGQPLPVLPLRDGSGYLVTREAVKHWQELHPTLNVTQEVRDMAFWLEIRQDQRKSHEDMGPFICTWLQRAEEEKADPSGMVPEDSSAAAAPMPEIREGTRGNTCPRAAVPEVQDSGGGFPGDF